MALGGYPSKNQVRDTHSYDWRLLGANGAALTVVTGEGATFGYTSEGLYKVTFPDNPGVLCGANYAFQAATPGDLKGYTLVLDTIAAGTGTTWVMPFAVYDSGFNIADLIANQWLFLTLKFQR